MTTLFSGWAQTLQDGWTLFLRLTRHTLRNPETLLVGILLPVILMLMFVFVFGGAIATGTEYVNYVVPGIIVTCVGYGTSMTATSVNLDMTGGMYERLRAMPVRPVSLLLGHVANSLVRNGIGAVLVFLVALAVGFRPSAGWAEWLGVALFLGLFFLAVCWLAILFGLLAGSAETAGAFAFVIMFLPYVSSAFVPTETMPSWLRAFAEYQPVTPLIETLRGLLVGGGAAGSDATAAAAWFGILLLASFAAAAYVFARKR
ncbi:ABC transporter permease [Paenibacillus antri]|uniref:Transport permease protein n=1 Tax=Paenibacillus antri TaxID=2582848 RepID=A0A5R9G075_9BACL|nr:ABC transporter permease [Paenibacillus antri]TLS48399.1 ABC transporter permease [Paenibacillus antri]